MSRSYWIAAIAFGVIIWAGSGQAQEEAQREQGQTTAQQPPSQTLPIPLPVDIIEDEATADARERREAEARQHEIDDLAAQQGMNMATQAMNEATQRMALYALCSTILVAIGTALLIWTLWLTRQANKAAQDAVAETRRIGEAQVRAYLSVSDCRIEVSGPELRMKVVFEIRNTGNSPAKNLHAIIRLRTGIDDYLQVFDDRGKMVDVGRYRLMNAMAADSTEYKSAFPGTLKKVFAKRQPGRIKFYIEGFLEYQTVFSQREQTEADALFCFRYIEDNSVLRDAIGDRSDKRIEIIPKSLTNVPIDWVSEYPKSQNKRA